MVHHVGCEARRRISVAITALNTGDRNMRRVAITSRDRAVMAARTIGVAG